jgi:hypothetical protein
MSTNISENLKILKEFLQAKENKRKDLLDIKNYILVINYINV